MIYLILGVSSVGKSTYIHSQLQGQFKELPIYLANELNANNYHELLRPDCVVHYNLLRPYSNSSENLGNMILDDSVFSYLLEYSDRIEARIMAVSLPVLAKRVLLRNISEPLLKSQIKENYPGNKVFELIHRINYLEFHNDWINFIMSRGIRLKFLSIGENSFYSESHSRESFIKEVKGDDSINYSESEVEYILDNYKFEYQQINVLNQKKTTGSDRSITFEEIKDKVSFTDKTVLDIGCAYGYFCFESEKLKAKRVVGTELKAHRFIGSNIIKHLTASQSEFKYDDVFDDGYSERFDIVLLLNVIHHLPFPMSALKKAASLAKKVLVLEFPTLSDKKFLATLKSGVEIDPSLPLVGVSLMDEQDQTFVFSQEAIIRMLCSNNNYFESIEFVKSPISDTRLLAFCYK